MRADNLRHPLLGADEERGLLAQAQSGDQAARDRLVTCNLRLVMSVAKSFRRRGEDLDDLVSEGTLGLFRAIERFDLSRTTRFSTYASHWIRQFIRRSLVKDAPIRLPEYLLSLVAAWNAAADHLKSTGRRVSDEEIAAHLQLSVRRLRTVQCAIRLSRSVLEDAPRDTAEPDKQLPFDVATCLSLVTRKEASVLRRRFGLGGFRPQLLSEIGEAMGLSKQRVQQIEERAKVKIREALTARV